MAAGPGFEPERTAPKAVVLTVTLPGRVRELRKRRVPQRSLEENAEGRIRTDMGVAPQRFLRPPRLPFRHSGI
jgi:hypothetical protein